MAEVPRTKTCRLRGVPRPRSEFARRTRSRDGLQRHCKACGRATLDAADARAKAERQARRAPSSPLTEYAAFVGMIAARAEEIADALDDCVELGEPERAEPYVLEFLVTRLFGDAPENEDDDPLEARTLRLLASVHTGMLAEQLTAAGVADPWFGERAPHPVTASAE